MWWGGSAPARSRPSTPARGFAIIFPGLVKLKFTHQNLGCFRVCGHGSARQAGDELFDGLANWSNILLRRIRSCWIGTRKARLIPTPRQSFRGRRVVTDEQLLWILTAIQDIPFSAEIMHRVSCMMKNEVMKSKRQESSTSCIVETRLTQQLEWQRGGLRRPCPWERIRPLDK